MSQNFLPFEGWTIVHYMSAPHVVYLPVSEHWGCLHILAVVNNDAGVNMVIRILLWDLLSIYPEAELLYHTVVLFLVFSTTAAPFCIPTNSAQGFLLLHVLTNTGYFLGFLGRGHSDGREVRPGSLSPGSYHLPFGVVSLTDHFWAVVFIFQCRLTLDPEREKMVSINHLLCVLWKMVFKL